MRSKLYLSRIPPQYRFAHRFTFYLHDYLADVVIHGEGSEIFDYEFDGRGLALDEIDRDDPLNWLLANGFEKEAGEIALRQCFVALLSDSCHHIYESLVNMEKSKFNVALTLLRKPIKDNLFYFEWFLAEPGELLSRFLSQEVKTYDVSRMEPADKKRILDKAQALCGSTEYLAQDQLYGFRYDRKSSFGLSRFCDQAIHLVTNNANYETERQNFNMIFRGSEIPSWKFDLVYSTLPLILMHTVDVVQALLSRITQVKEEEAAFHALRRSVGFALFAYSVSEDAMVASSNPESGRLCLEEDPEVSCDNCGNHLLSSVRSALYFFYHGVLRCTKCCSSRYFADRPPFGYCELADSELTEFLDEL